MDMRQILVKLDQPDVLQSLAAELQRRRALLVQRATDGLIADLTDRENILRYFRDEQLPAHPTTIEEVLKNLASSALSYAPVRRALASRIGSSPTASTIARALASEFNDTRFLDDSFWNPVSMISLSLDVAARLGLTNSTLGGKTLRPRILGVLHDGSTQLASETRNGLPAFYAAVDQHTTSPESAWRFLERFSAEIREVGPPLSADFMKNIGFHVFVKPDFHFLEQLPKLSGIDVSFSPRDSFTLGWLLASALNMPAFVLDHILYQWGRHGDPSSAASEHTLPRASNTRPPCLPTSALSGSPKSASTGNNLVLLKLLETPKWQAECTKLTIHRQKQLEAILAKYDHRSIPISHFTEGHRRDASLCNQDAYPAVCALMCGVLVRTGDRLHLREGIVLGRRVLP